MKAVVITIAVSLAAFMTFGFYSANTPEGRARSQDRAVIERCRDDQSSASLSPGSVRSMASTCEKLEADYRAKWNREP